MAEAWARLARGLHLLYFARPKVAAVELRAARRLFERLGDRAGHVLARAGLARGLWRIQARRPRLRRVRRTAP